MNEREAFETSLFLSESEEQKGEEGFHTQGYFKKDLTKKPLITVITVVFNAEKVLEKTILSVINQTYDNVEYIIIDGGSTDGTLDIIKKYKDHIDYLLSENDRGIYDAMNKGIILSHGQWVNFLNAGDYYFDNNVLYNLPIHSLAKIIFGNIRYESDKVFESTFNWKMYLKNSLHHQAAFYSSDLFKKVGLFDINFKILADYDFNLKVLALNIQSEKVLFYISICSDYGISDTPNLINYHEEAKIRLKNTYILGLLLGTYSYLRYIGKKIFRIFCSIKNTKSLLSNK